MKPIPLNAETGAIARRVVWFEEPADALEDPVRFMAYAMKHATHEDMKALRCYVSDDDFREALDKAPPGIIDPRSLGLLEFQDGAVSRTAHAQTQVGVVRRTGWRRRQVSAALLSRAALLVGTAWSSGQARTTSFAASPSRKPSLIGCGRLRLAG